MPASKDAAAAPSMAAPPAPTLPPVDYRGYPPPPYYDPYYDLRYDPYGPPPPRYSPEFRSRYAYPPPPRVSPRGMYRGAPGPRGPPHGQTPGQFRGPRRPSPTRDDASAGDKENLKSAVNGGAKRDSSGTPKAKDSETPKGGTMEHAVDNIIAAAQQIEKRDTPPNGPADKKTPTSEDASAATTANSSAAPSANDPQSSPPPPSFHRYSTSPVFNLPPHALSHPMGPPPPPGPPGFNYDPYFDYRYDYYDYYGPPPPPYDHPPHCQCQYCSPAKRRAPTYPPPAWDYDYNLELSSPDEPPKKRRKDKRPYHTYSNATKHKANVRKLNPAEEEAQVNRVKRLADEVKRDPSLYRAVLLHMALEKESPKKKPSFDVDEVFEGFTAPIEGGSMAGSPNSMNLPSPHGFAVENRGMIGEGFYWKDYPLLENVLRKSMDEYYEMSENCPQSKQQQQFNNRLVSKIYHTAISLGYTFDPIAYTGGSTPLTERKKSKKEPNHEYEPLPPGFNYKKLRDRIRCYYKTHVQNSKKRLTTILKNPTKPKNREILLRVVAEVRSEGYVGPLSGNWDGPKTKKSKVTPSVTFSSDDDFGLGSFSADSASPTEAGRVMVQSTQVQASPFRRMEHAQILSSMRESL